VKELAFLNFLYQPKNELEKGGRALTPVQEDVGEPEKTCPNCHKSIPLSRLWANQNTCPCGYHFRMSARQRLDFIADKDTFVELFRGIGATPPIPFPGYPEKLETTRISSKEEEAVLCGTAKIGGQTSCLFIMEPYFMMGSMGTAVGERITRLFEFALEKRLSVVGYTVSGGARMQEGLFSLMQMAKTSGAVKRHSDAGLFYLPILTDPTTGGVTASFAMEGDIILAEPGATVGFAGARVIEQTTRKALPKGFQTSEFLLEHGFIDAIVPRREQRAVVAKLLETHCGGEEG
jgi:acetyl-CoA carboxylase carboxyl transferase beta subunit